MRQAVMLTRTKAAASSYVTASGSLTTFAAVHLHVLGQPPVGVLAQDAIAPRMIIGIIDMSSFARASINGIASGSFRLYFQGKSRHRGNFRARVLINGRVAHRAPVFAFDEHFPAKRVDRR